MATKKNAEAANKAENNEAVNSGTVTEKNEATGGNAVKKAENESVYTVNEFAKASKTAFDKPYSPDIVRAAMKMAGKTEATKSEAAEIIKRFLGKEKEE